MAWLKPQRGDGLWHKFLARIKWSDTAVYALTTDHRGAVLAVTTLESEIARRKTLWQSHINAWGAVQVNASTTLDPKLRLVNQYADIETGLSYNIARYYDPAAGRYISPDPAGIADSIDQQTPDSLKLDITVYASGQPYLYFDPDAAAKITYYAITTGTSGQALGTTQGFTKARWAFQITGIQAGGDASTLGQLRNQYAQNGTSLLFDGGGNFVSGFNVIDSIKSPDGQSIRWDASSTDNVVQSFGTFYGSNLISISQFTINTVDDNNATSLIRYLSSTQQDRAKCKAGAPGWLPEVKFAAEEVPIKVILAANGDASKQRILACGDGSNTNLDQRRIAKYEAAAEINETRSPKEINKDCSLDGCPGVIYYCTTSKCVGQYSAPPTATTYIASYGRSQFIGVTLVSELISAYGTFTAVEKAAIGLTPTMKTLLDAAVVRATKLSAWWSTIPAAASYAAASTTWDSLPPSQQATFNSDTGLGEQAYEDIVRMKTSPPTNSKGTSLLSDAKQGFITSAIMSDVTLANFLMGIFKDFDKFTIMSQALMRKNMNLVLSKFPNASEEEIAGRVARLHNGGPGSNWDAASFSALTSSDAFNYVKRFLGWPGYKSEGDWYSLRCTESL